jgi:Right handed beta helix region
LPYATIQAAASAARPGSVVLVHAGNYAGFTVNTSGTAASPIVFRANGTNVVIDRGSSSEGDGIRLQEVSYVQIEGFTIRNTSSSSTRVHRCIAARGATATSPMRGNVIRRNTCTDADADGFYLSQFSQGLVENNVITNTGRDGEPRGHGIYLANAGSDGTTIRGNRISSINNAESEGIHCNGDASIGGDGLITELTIEANSISSTGGNNAINFDGVQNAVIRNNLVMSSGHHALRAYTLDGAAGPRNLRIVNNTFVTNSGWAVKITEDGGGHVVFNNILLGSSGSLAVGSAGSLASNGNIVSGTFSDDEESSTLSLSAWRSRTAQDAASVVATSAQLFVNAAGGNYALASSSPARDKGLSILAGLAAPSTDLTGASRQQGSAPDVGAMEFKP